MRVVISQSMYFPWAGLLEQIRLADVFIHYDDVQFSKGSFTNRVQVKTPDGNTTWMTVPLDGAKLGQRIDETAFLAESEWNGRHLNLLSRSFADAPYGNEAVDIARRVVSREYPHIGALARESMLALCNFFGLTDTTSFRDSTEFAIGGAGSRRVLDLVKAVGGVTYLTGHGARNYLDHAMFEREGVRVEYIDYQKKPYPQLHGPFTPYVTSLDLVACCGPAGKDYLVSEGREWREFLDET